MNSAVVICKDLQLRRPSGKSVRLWSCRLGFDSESGYTHDLKIGIHDFLACRLALRDNLYSKPASLLVPLGKALSKIRPSWCGRQMAGNS